MLWIILSLTAAALWGLDYALTEKALTRVSIPTLMILHLVATIIVVIVYSIIKGGILNDFNTIINDRKLMLIILTAIVSSAIAGILIYASIVAKNAALAGLVEISYPIFIIIFSYLIFGQSHLTKSVIIGGIMIFAGVATIYLGN